MKRSRWLDRAIVIFGGLSFASLIMYYLALHDIWHDYASAEVWARAGTALPSWYDPVSRCLGEWSVLQVGFPLMMIFHILLFARRMQGRKSIDR